MMSSALPTLATKGESQVIYTGSAGFPTSTQLGLVRQRAYAHDPAVALLEWAAQRPVYDEAGRLVGGDDPTDPRTWARVNPSLGPPFSHDHVITQEYIGNEMGALGGPRSPHFWRERLGIGDYPIDDERWAVVAKQQWEDCLVADSQPAPWRVHAFDTDPLRDVTTMVVVSWSTVGGQRTDRVHVEVVARHRGSLWCAGIAAEHAAGMPAGAALFTVLPSGAAAHLKGALVRRGLRVEVPSMPAYAGACESLAQRIRGQRVAHLGQRSLRSALGGADKRAGVEGGWVWSRDVPSDQAPIVAATIGLWALETHPEVRADDVGDVW
jgi:hypothetical protein